MFRRHKKRHTNIVFVIFRLILSFVIFAALLGGVYSAYKHFSGVDALKLDPKAIVLGIMSSNRDIVQIINKIPGIKGKWEMGNGKLEREVRGEKSNITSQDQPSHIPRPTSKLAFRFALFADSHSDNLSLKKALEQITKDYSDIRFIIGLGDYTDVGTLDELKKAKNELDSSGFRYFVTVGDHDLWDSRNKQSLPSSDGKSLAPSTNFSQVFGPTYQSFIHENFLFVILHNSDNYLGLGEDQKKWMRGQLDSNKSVLGTFVFLHEPLFHPSSDHFMGRVEGELKDEAQKLTKQLVEGGIKKVFAGDTHFFSEYTEPQTNLPMLTVGAITSERNLQLPRFAIVSVYEDGSTKVEDVEVK